jgi:hypothetical protein
MSEVVLKDVKPGSIVLFHANGRGWNTPEALPNIVNQLKARGYQFVTVSELLTYPGAKPILASSCYDEKPGDSDKYDAFFKKRVASGDLVDPLSPAHAPAATDALSGEIPPRFLNDSISGN